MSHTQVNTAAKDLESSVQSVCLFHRGEEADSHFKATPRFLCQLSQDPYHSTEDKYLSELTAYTKKQFFDVRMFVDFNTCVSIHLTKNTLIY